MKRKRVSLLVASITGCVLVAALILTASPALAVVNEEFVLVGPPTDSSTAFEIILKLALLFAQADAEANVDWHHKDGSITTTPSQTIPKGGATTFTLPSSSLASDDVVTPVVKVSTPKDSPPLIGGFIPVVKGNMCRIFGSPTSPTEYCQELLPVVTPHVVR